ncbi:tRNA threonylcarbamoyladenosine dehydratase [Flavonifractor sp. An306]|uniref:tRNA threonylcarbamoyladenosine dehydratase n=1 Tax=Flavonifractor sp. An306 TaxID=1965629 RepID=UPI000B3AA13B|nr:tRNA threonylcarbamoyladenosine dehydratase [Flavonifractor sp. An306]OUO38791.1 tRNA threonylcarbamoyladenosine dehydratase [Flavonifractor sp. An306]
MDERFLRTEMLLGTPAMEKLTASHVAVFGLGGVGSWCAEALARSGVGALTLVDHDQVGLTNLNRQVEATLSTLGKPKAQAMAERIADINPGCAVTARAEKYEAENREAFFSLRYDYVVDCIDLVSCKLDLIQTCLERGIPILSALGTGNKLDPSQFRIGDISQTEGCPLARVVRKELRNRGIRRHRVLWSPELPRQAEQREAPPPGRRSVPGSVAWVPPVAGLMMAGDVICALTGTQI